MHELTGKITNISFSYNTGKPLITFEMDDKRNAMNMAEKLLPEEKLTIKVDKFRKKRSLDANAYAWVLIGKLSEKTNIPAEEIYRAAIKEIGNYEIVCVQNEAVDSLRSVWEKNGIGWQTATMPSRIEGCTNVVLHYGSSTYDVAQMARLITNLQQDCEQLGIETKSPEELLSLLNSWGGR